MRSLCVAPGNACASSAALALTLARGLLVSAVACGADATGGGSGGETASASASVAALQPASAGADEQIAAVTPAAPAEPSDDEAGPSMLAAPSVPLSENPPPAPSPPPTSELVTPRAVNAPPMDVAVNDCRFEYLGEWVRCEHAGWPNVVETEASDLVSCIQRCLERDDCTAVTDYLWLGLPGIGCSLYLSTCDSPEFVVWGEEDAGRDYRRTCSDQTDDWRPIDAGAPAVDPP